MNEYEWECPYCVDGGNDVSELECALCHRKPPTDPATYREMVAIRDRNLREGLFSVHRAAANMNYE